VDGLQGGVERGTAEVRDGDFFESGLGVHGVGYYRIVDGVTDPSMSIGWVRRNLILCRGSFSNVMFNGK
jgi:hypothetical protein